MSAGNQQDQQDQQDQKMIAREHALMPMPGPGLELQGELLSMTTTPQGQAVDHILAMVDGIVFIGADGTALVMVGSYLISVDAEGHANSTHLTTDRKTEPDLAGWETGYEI